MSKIRVVFKRCILLIIVLIIWQYASMNTTPLFIPSPKKVYDGFLSLINNGLLIKGLWYSFRRITTAALISSIISICMGLIIHEFVLCRDIFEPIIRLLRYIPVTAFYPLLILWVGIDDKMKVVFLFIATFLYMLPTVVLQLNEVSQELIDTGKSIGMNRIQILIRILLPSTIPSILETFVMMYGIGWTYIAVCETINAKYGLGYIIQQSSSRGRTDLVFVAIATIMVFSIIFDNTCKYIIKKVFKWKYINKCN